MPQTNILIVEDDLTTQEMAKMVLENAGYGVSVAHSAEDAERIVANMWPDIVLMDRDLPGMDGLELTRRLKIAEATSNITIIAFSSMQSTEDNEKALAAGSDGFVHKPFTVRGLLQTVAWHVSARESHAGSSRPNKTAATPDCSAPNDIAWHTSAAAGRHADGAASAFAGFMKISRSTIMSGLLVIAAVTSTYSIMGGV